MGNKLLVDLFKFLENVTFRRFHGNIHADELEREEDFGGEWPWHGHGKGGANEIEQNRRQSILSVGPSFITK
jgi:hypothetical protein